MSKFSVELQVKRIVSLLLDGGARDCILVGGSVRDKFLGFAPKDFDVEVYGLTYDEILKILRSRYRGRINFVGQSFGTIKVGSSIDISIPRVESKSGVGHRGFDVKCDPNLDLFSAFSRRDFTINAIGIRVDNSIYDPFDGVGDIKRKLLRAPTDAFCEDPLRVLRGMQFAARFGFSMDSKTLELCKRVCDEFNTLSVERVWGEWSKWALKGVEPSRGLFVLKDAGWIRHFPEIADLIIVTKIQSTKFGDKIHESENAFINTARICDAAAKIADKFNFNDEDRLTLIFSALCYNMGKAENNLSDDLSYQELLSSDLAFRQSNLSVEIRLSSASLASRFLNRLKPPARVVDRVLSTVSERLTNFFVTGERIIEDNCLRCLAVRLEPSSIRIWAALCRAIIEASYNSNANLIRQIEECQSRAEKLNIINCKPRPILQGRDLIPNGVKPDREMGKILNNAYEAQLDGVFNNIEEAIIWYDNYYNK
jgi:tRNA nucleotidyltransferase (CCA-adding enzyme)